MNTDAHHSGKAHSTHGFSRASATHGRYTQGHNHKAQHGYPHSHSLRNTARVHTESQPQTQGTARLHPQSQPQKHSTGTHTVTASETQHGYARSHSHKNTIRRYKNLLNNGEHNTNTDTGE